MARPFILVSSDESCDSPGLMAAVAALTELGEILTAAPLAHQSGTGGACLPGSSGIIHRSEIIIKGCRLPAFAVYGSRVQSVGYSFLRLAPRLSDPAVSGNNPASISPGIGTYALALDRHVAVTPAQP